MLAHALDVGAFESMFQDGTEAPLVVAVRGVVPGAELVDLLDARRERVDLVWQSASIVGNSNCCGRCY